MISVTNAGMPKRIEKAKIALINSALEIEKTEMSAEIRINDPQQMQKFLDEENKMLKSMADKVSVGYLPLALVLVQVFLKKILIFHSDYMENS